MSRDNALRTVPGVDLDEMAADWGRRVAATRAKRKLSQGGLATAAGLQQQYVSRIEAGRVIPSDMVKLRLARALGIKTGTLFPWPD